MVLKQLTWFLPGVRVVVSPLRRVAAWEPVSAQLFFFFFFFGGCLRSLECNVDTRTALVGEEGWVGREEMGSGEHRKSGGEGRGGGGGVESGTGGGDGRGVFGVPQAKRACR